VVSVMTAGQTKSALTLVVSDGWAAAGRPELDAAIRAQGPALEAAFAALKFVP